MKKFFILILLAFVVFQSCKKDDIGGTATEAAAGEWFVTADAIKADGSIFEEDLFGLGHFLLATYNTSDNSTDKLWIDDNKNFWEFKGVTKVDVNALTFSGDNVNNVSIAGETFTITNGKILKGAATTPSGMPADSIVFEVKFSDDTYPAKYGYDRYRIGGYRYTGLTNDEDH